MRDYRPGLPAWPVSVLSILECSFRPYARLLGQEPVRMDGVRWRTSDDPNARVVTGGHPGRNCCQGPSCLAKGKSERWLRKTQTAIFDSSAGGFAPP